MQSSSTPMPTWDAPLYARHGSYVPQLARDLLGWLGARPGDTILDVGCGDGALTARIADQQARVIGIDSSAELVAVAQARGLDARIMDAHALGLTETFDAVFSNAALHWMHDPARVLAEIHRVLKPGGRLVGELGAAGNVASVLTLLEDGLRRRGVDPARVNPWSFPTAEAWRDLLRAQNFTVSAIQVFDRPTRLTDGLRGWLQTFAGHFLAALPADTHAAYLDEVVQAWEAQAHKASGQWVLEFVRLRFCAQRPR